MTRALGRRFESGCLGTYASPARPFSGDLAAHGIVAGLEAGEMVVGVRAEPERRAYGAATVGGGVGGALGAGLTLLVALPFWPRGETDAWAELGWTIFTLIACSTVGIAAGAVGIVLALRRQNAPHAGLTAGVFVPTAVLLLFGGPLVFAAPVAARWMSLGLQQWCADRRGAGPVARRRESAGGRPQRVVLWGVLTLLGMTLLASQSNSALGGGVGGGAKVGFLCAAVPVLLLPIIWRAVPVWAVAGLLLGALLTGAVMARTVTADLHPTPERLAQIARGVEPPVGQRVVSRTSALAHRFPQRGALAGGEPQPVEIVGSMPTGGERIRLPPELTPDENGYLPHEVTSLSADASNAGLAAAARWERALRDDGWAPDPPGSGGAARSMDWLPPPASNFVGRHGGRPLGRGLWQQAVVIPFGDGAIIVFSTRP